MDEQRVLAHIYKTFNGIINVVIDEFGIDIHFTNMWDAFAAYDDITDYNIPSEEIIFWQDEEHKRRFSVGILKDHYEIFMVESGD